MNFSPLIAVKKGGSAAGIAGLALFAAKILAPLIPSPIPMPPEVLAGGLVALITGLRNAAKHLLYRKPRG